VHGDGLAGTLKVAPVPPGENRQGKECKKCERPGESHAQV
jgi:hypothetical protein